jgi:superfamily I DNA/RNA helicase
MLTKIEGLPGSGKTRALAREACRLAKESAVAPGQLLLLAVSGFNKRRIQRYLAMEAPLVGLSALAFNVLTLDEWLLSLCREFAPDSGKPLCLLSEQESTILLHALIQQDITLNDPLYYASRQPSFARAFWELIRQWQIQELDLDKSLAHCIVLSDNLTPPVTSTNSTETPLSEDRATALMRIYRQFASKTWDAGLLPAAALGRRALKLFQEQPERLQTLASRYHTVLIDEAQELSATHHQLLAALSTPLVLAGQSALSIRSFRGAQPTQFESLEPYQDIYKAVPETVQSVVKTHCYRGNESILRLLAQAFDNSALLTVKSADWLPTVSLSENASARNAQEGSITTVTARENDCQSLVEDVKFGFYPDLESEALGIAEQVARFVQSGVVEGRPAQWQDCVILLRSGRFKPALLSAFLQYGIPFRSDGLSESLIVLQHRIYDFFKILAGLAQLNLPTESLMDPMRLRKSLTASPLGLSDSLDGLRDLNRHLRRWLEAALGDAQSAVLLRQLGNAETASGDQDDFLWAVLLEKAPDAASLHALNALQAFYASYQKTGAWFPLWDRLVTYLVNTDADLRASAEASAAFHALKEQLSSLNAQYQAIFQKSVPLEALLVHYAALWEGLELQMESENASPEGVFEGVRFLSLHQAQGEEFPWVAIPFLVSGEFPRTRDLPEILSESEIEASGLPSAYGTPYRINEAEEARLLVIGMTRATQRLVLSCHQTEGEEPVHPSPFYRTLLAAKRHLLAEEALPHICGCEMSESHWRSWDKTCQVDYCPQAPASPAVPDEGSMRYSGESAWSCLEKQPDEALFAPDETITLSASSIKTYMTCPRQFYYKHLLRLPQSSSEAAALGTLVHRVMEVFNTQADRTNYTPERLKTLVDTLFLFSDSPDTFLEAGFTEQDARKLSVLSHLTLISLRERLSEAVDDLVRKGYFQRYGQLRQVEAEKMLRDITLEGLERCRLTGVVDALIQLEDGRWDILDYKTFSTAYGTAVDRCEQHFRSTLEPLSEAEGLTHGERFAATRSRSYPKDYQLPLYYLACNQDPLYRGKLRSVALQIVRPAFPERPEQGAILLEIMADEVEAKKEQLISDIRRFIVDPILSGDSFEANPNPDACGFCAYAGICQSGDASDMDSSADSNSKEGAGA